MQFRGGGTEIKKKLGTSRDKRKTLTESTNRLEGFNNSSWPFHRRFLELYVTHFISFMMPLRPLKSCVVAKKYNGLLNENRKSVAANNSRRWRIALRSILFSACRDVSRSCKFVWYFITHLLDTLTRNESQKESRTEEIMWQIDARVLCLYVGVEIRPASPSVPEFVVDIPKILDFSSLPPSVIFCYFLLLFYFLIFLFRFSLSVSKSCIRGYKLGPTFNRHIRRPLEKKREIFSFLSIRVSSGARAGTKPAGPLETHTRKYQY